MARENTEADVERMRSEAMEQARADFERFGEICPSRAAIYGLDGKVNLVSLDVDDKQQRRVIQEFALKHQAWLVHHLQESWYVEAPRDDAQKVEALELASLLQALNLHPERREILIFWEEHHGADIRRWTAEITRDGQGHPTLGAWQASTLTLPRPGFKRYLALSFSSPATARREVHHVS